MASVNPGRPSSNKMADLKLVTKHYPVGNYSYPRAAQDCQSRALTPTPAPVPVQENKAYRPEYKTRQASLGSNSSVPGMVDDDQDSDASAEDEYQNSTADEIWDSFWPVTPEDEVEKPQGYPALIPGLLSSSHQGGRQRQRQRPVGICVQDTVNLLREDDELPPLRRPVDDAPSWPLPNQAALPERPRTAAPQVRTSTYSLFPAPTAQQQAVPRPHLPPRTTSLTAPVWQGVKSRRHTASISSLSLAASPSPLPDHVLPHPRTETASPSPPLSPRFIKPAEFSELPPPIPARSPYRHRQKAASLAAQPSMPNLRFHSASASDVTASSTKNAFFSSQQAPKSTRLSVPAQPALAPLRMNSVSSALAPRRPTRPSTPTMHITASSFFPGHRRSLSQAKTQPQLSSLAEASQNQEETAAPASPKVHIPALPGRPQILAEPSRRPPPPPLPQLSIPPRAPSHAPPPPPVPAPKSQPQPESQTQAAASSQPQQQPESQLEAAAGLAPPCISVFDFDSDSESESEANFARRIVRNFTIHRRSASGDTRKSLSASVRASTSSSTYSTPYSSVSPASSVAASATSASSPGASSPNSVGSSSSSGSSNSSTSSRYSTSSKSSRDSTGSCLVPPPLVPRARAGTVSGLGSALVLSSSLGAEVGCGGGGIARSRSDAGAVYGPREPSELEKKLLRQRSVVHFGRIMGGSMRMT